MSLENETKAYETLQSFKTLLKYAPGVSRQVDQRLKELRLKQLITFIAREECHIPFAQIKSEMADLKSKLNGHSVANKSKVFLVSTLFLAESFHYLSRQPEESLHFASGSIHEGCINVNFFLPVDLQRATSVGAQADDQSLFRTFSTLESMGHSLTGVFHIHPGNGIASIRPSSTDQAYMKRLDGRPVVFGIWARDAVLRLISLGPGHEIRFHGEGIKELDRNAREVVCQLNRRLPRSLLGLD